MDSSIITTIVVVLSAEEPNAMGYHTMREGNPVMTKIDQKQIMKQR
jgi:hypothetical protein